MAPRLNCCRWLTLSHLRPLLPLLSSVPEESHRHLGKCHPELHIPLGRSRTGRFRLKPIRSSPVDYPQDTPRTWLRRPGWQRRKLGQRPGTQPPLSAAALLFSEFSFLIFSCMIFVAEFFRVIFPEDGVEILQPTRFNTLDERLAGCSWTRGSV